jgi:hypothetical protein
VERSPQRDRVSVALLLVGAIVAAGGIGFAIGSFTAGDLGFGTGANFVARGSFDPAAMFANFAAQTQSVGSGGAVSGTVKSITSSSMTLQLADGTTVTIDLSGSPIYHNEASASGLGVSVGSTVVVQLENGVSASASATVTSTNEVLRARDIIVTNR